MSTDTPTRQEGTARETVAIELAPADARMVVGGLKEFENRSRQSSDPAEQEAAERYADVQDTILSALDDDKVAIDRRQLIDLAGLAEQVLADGLEDQAINAAYEAADVDTDGADQ